MDQQTFQKAAEMIHSANSILLVPHVRMDCDAMSSTIAMFLFLQKMGKRVTAVCSDPVPEAYQFLPSTDIFKHHIEGGNEDLIVTIDTTQVPFKDLRYTLEEGKVNIVLSAENGSFSESDFSFQKYSQAPDLIISLDTADLPQLGKLYEDNAELFRRVPFLNIDHHVSNTNFGTLNLVVMTNCSTTETLYDLFPYISEESEKLMDEDIVTLILAGMITDTGSFQHANTTPKALDIAGNLIEKGARQQEIIKYLFKTKEISTLRLWGRILSKIQNDPIYRLVWSSVNMNDLLETESKSDETEGLIDELLATTPGSEMVLLVREREDGAIATSIRTSSNFVNAIELASQFGGGGHRQSAGFKIYNRGGKSFEEILGDIITSAKVFQANRLKITPPQGIVLPVLDTDTLPFSPNSINASESFPDFSEESVPAPSAQHIPPLEGFDPPQDYRNEHDQEHFLSESIAPSSEEISGFSFSSMSNVPVTESFSSEISSPPEIPTDFSDPVFTPFSEDSTTEEFDSTPLSPFLENENPVSPTSEPGEESFPIPSDKEIEMEETFPNFSFEEIAPNINDQDHSSESTGSEISSLLHQQNAEKIPESNTFSALNAPETDFAENTNTSENNFGKTDDFEAFMARIKEEELKKQKEKPEIETSFAGTEEFFNSKTEDQTQALLEEIQAERSRGIPSPNSPMPMPVIPSSNENPNTPKPIFEMFFKKKEGVTAFPSSEDLVHGDETVNI